MRKITAIEPQKKNPNRVNIALEGQFAFGLSRLVAAWLAVGQTLSDEKIAALLADDAREAALQKALLFLGYRARSSQEVRQNLAKHEIPEIVIAETLARLERSGLLNDGEFAHAWVENRSTFRPRGRRALKLELRQKGLSEESIQSALEQAASEDSLALEAARKYVRKLRGLDWLTFRNKLGGFLARRGFGYDVIAPVVRQVWNDYSNNLNDEDVG
ncbi:MAG: RecX family transcriptional regulator [Anaerolineae bacterium CG_4_9_14_3_um_filter_57_17]|nr:hypothetical protein [bacterium]NCT20573.1 hypothetical protein [bacterium]OIO86310.1 MAG: hypothetical protein AUK01_03430 [Anaerolineae bacterium CG2_30_57_67]PJB64872.1 MAG: RecX family transcriptional regulator [Anaerolineae bacterium CG_4_9_14_3_um_filter_57_17]